MSAVDIAAVVSPAITAERDHPKAGSSRLELEAEKVAKLREEHVQAAQRAVPRPYPSNWKEGA